MMTSELLKVKNPGAKIIALVINGLLQFVYKSVNGNEYKAQKREFKHGTLFLKSDMI